MALEKVQFNVQGIACSVCCRKLEHALSKLEGTLVIEVSLLKEQIEVSYLPDLIQPTKIKEALQDLGFSILEEGGLKRRRTIAPILPKAVLLGYILFGAIAVQSFHMAEHVAQVIQKFVLGLSQAHGLLGEVLDREWLHFGYNSTLLLLLFMFFLGYGFHKRDSWFATHRPLLAVFTGALAIQSYHVLEHTVKLSQYLMTGVEPAPGILGGFFNLVWLHFFINLAVYLPMLLAFFGYGFHENKLLLNLRHREIQNRRKN